ncbi:SLC13 family permease [Thioalbus denitrificans]|uniref:Sodium-dependent dicarboxylate transporter 2/3/5 n=1 Tax=Thioalbus denitrificans TaxID=547122 RepID=A0A369BXG3_9GAMM|nr:DASS family sodium-coupled anion symporter [Thioalbus denitrificans]RCX26031.1 sodium-dependent dicarboxylate transporter 2/3/5 [Thioalbus denitrificans]
MGMRSFLRAGGVRRIGLLLGPVLGLIAWLWLPVGEAGLTPGGRATAAIAAWMACWWLTQAVPLAVTALLPVVLFPLTGAASLAEATAPYSRSLIFLFLGGFILGLGLQRWGVHRRLALLTLLAAGTGPRRLVAGFMLASAGLSLWISNTATVIMLLPIGTSVLEMLRERDPDAPERLHRRLSAALLLGIAYAASIGGTGTLVGTPPNLVLAAFAREHYGYDTTVLEWLGIGLPLVALFLPLTWLFLTRVAFPLPARPLPGGRELLTRELRDLGPLARGERIVLAVFTLTAAGWILRPQLVALTGLEGLSDPVIAMIGALALFVIPVEPARGVFAMDWTTARQVPWDILILFGGGLSLAAAIGANGVDRFIAQGFVALQDIPLWLFLLALTGTVVLLTEITSNTAVATTLMPILAATALATGLPAGPLLTAATLAASCAFMLPVATPPNAIVFGSGRVTVGQMAGAGIGLNLIATLLVTMLVYLGGHLPLP